MGKETEPIKQEHLQTTMSECVMICSMMDMQPMCITVSSLIYLFMKICFRCDFEQLSRRVLMEERSLHECHERKDAISPDLSR